MDRDPDTFTTCVRVAPPAGSDFRADIIDEIRSVLDRARLTSNIVQKEGFVEVEAVDWTTRELGFFLRLLQRSGYDASVPTKADVKT